MTLRGYSFLEAFQNYTPAESVTAEDGIQMTIDNNFARSLVERSDTRGFIAYGIRHVPDANVKIFNASKSTDSSIALSFSSGKDQYDDIFKIIKRPSGGYELQLQKINTVVIDGKRIDVSSLAKML